MRKMSFEALLARLAARGREMVLAEGIPEDASPGSATPTSIRLKPSVRVFIEKQAEALGTSQQAIINMILDGVAQSTADPVGSNLRTIRERFFHVFEAHGLDLPAIVSVMAPFRFSLSDLSDDNRLLDRLGAKALRYLAETFFVQEEWIRGSRDYPIDTTTSNVMWYKNVHYSARRLLKYQESGMEPHVMFIRRCGADFERARREEDRADSEAIGVVVRLQRHTEDGRRFMTYEAWEFEDWNYWRCRQQIKHLIAFCGEAYEKRLMTFDGYQLEQCELELLKSGRILPVIALDEVHRVSWYPNDYASLSYEVTKEVDDWPVEREAYKRSRVSKIIETYATTGRIE